MASRKKVKHPGTKLKKTGRTPEPAAAELLFEIGVEELPYHFIFPALPSLKESAERLLRDQRLAFQL